jgi:hypothetical protein
MVVLMNTVVLFAVLGLWTAQAALAGYAATRKGRSFNIWTLAGLIIGPIAIALALVVPPRRLYG